MTFCNSLQHYSLGSILRSHAVRAWNFVPHTHSNLIYAQIHGGEYVPTQLTWVCVWIQVPLLAGDHFDTSTHPSIHSSFLPRSLSLKFSKNTPKQAATGTCPSSPSPSANSLPEATSTSSLNPSGLLPKGIVVLVSPACTSRRTHHQLAPSFGATMLAIIAVFRASQARRWEPLQGWPKMTGNAHPSLPRLQPSLDTE